MKSKRAIYVLVTLMSVALVVLAVVQYVWISHAIKLQRAQFDAQVANAMQATAAAVEAKASLGFLAGKLKADSLAEWTETDSGFYHFFTDENAPPAPGAPQNVTVTVREEKDGAKRRVVVRTRTKEGSTELDEEHITVNVMPDVPEPPAPPLPPAVKADKSKRFISIVTTAANEYASSEANWQQLPDSATLVQTLHTQLAKRNLPLTFQFAVRNAHNDSVLLANAAGPFAYTQPLLGFAATNKGLWLQLSFPQRMGHVLYSMLGLLILSLGFSAIMVVVFVMALQLIFKQRKLNEITNDFIGNMTHEFKTPLATISLTADTLNLQNAQSPEQVKEYAGLIKEEAKKLSEHVDRILESALNENGSAPKAAAVDLRAAIHRQLHHYAPVIQQAHAKVDTHLPPEPVMVWADEEKLGYVISNLFDNALKYSGAAPKMQVACHVGVQKVTLTVTDNGIGITKADQQLIFEKFFRAHTGLRHDVKGFGLGLNFVKNAVESWGGQVQVQSEPGKGSAFMVEFKRAL